MTDAQLIDIYENHGGEVFAKACDYIDSLVPDKLMIDGEQLLHHPTHYCPVSSKFAYFSVKTANFVFLAFDEVKASHRA